MTIALNVTFTVGHATNGHCTTSKDHNITHPKDYNGTGRLNVIDLISILLMSYETYKKYFTNSKPLPKYEDLLEGEKMVLLNLQLFCLNSFSFLQTYSQNFSETSFKFTSMLLRLNEFPSIL